MIYLGCCHWRTGSELGKLLRVWEDLIIHSDPLYDRPLLPSTCQSVRMDFIALKPGVHSIEVLTLTDVQSGVTMNLR